MGRKNNGRFASQVRKRPFYQCVKLYTFPVELFTHPRLKFAHCSMYNNMLLSKQKLGSFKEKELF